MGVYGVSTYGVGVYGPDSTVAPTPTPTPTPPLPAPDPSPDAGPGPRPPITGGDVIAGALPQFSVSPFTLNQITYGQFFLEWSTPQHSSDPTEDWRFFRLLRSDTGVPVSYTDGVPLIDVDSWHSGVPDYAYDTGLTEGRFYYYSIWLGQSTGNNQTEAQATWYNVANVVGLAVANYGWTERLWGWIPRFYRYGEMEFSEDADNHDQPLYKFVNVLGFHLDMINTDISAGLDLYNPKLMQYGALETYGASVGSALEPTVTARLNRERIGNAAFDQLLRGTSQGLENVLSSLTGWDVEIDMGRNLLLNGDQSGPDHPVTPEWVYEYVYQQGEVVQYQGYQYSANLTHTGRIPPLGGGSNTYWSPAVGWSSTVFQGTVTSMSQATWQLSGAGTFTVVSGLPNVLDAAASSDSGWKTVNTGISTATPSVYFPGGTDFVTPPTMNEVIKDGVPIPATLELDTLSASLHVYWAPGDPKPVGANPFIDFYDDLGNLLAHIAKPFWAPIYDSFTNDFDITLSSEITDTGNVWTVSSDAWRVSNKGYVYVNSVVPGTSYAYMNMLRPDLSVAVTLSNAATNGLLLRYADVSNHIRVSATSVQTLVGGITSTLAAFPSPFVTGDRMQATIIGNTLTVKKNNGNKANGWSETYTISALTSNTNFGIWKTT